MKIIARTKDGFLVEATDRELANCAGFDHEHAWREKQPEAFNQYSSGGYGYNYAPKVGTEINVRTPHAMFTALRASEKEVENAANILTTAATLLRTAVPKFAIPPEELTQETES